MSFKAKQHGLFNAQFTNVPKTKRYVLSVVVYNFLFVSLLFSLNGFAADDVSDAGNVSDVSDISDAGDVGNVSDVGDMGDISDAGDVGNVSDVSDAGDVGNVSDVGDMGDISDAGDVGNVSNVSDVSDAGNMLYCNQRHTWERHNNLNKMIKESPDIIKDIHLIYNLAKVSLCMEIEKGIDQLREASENGHIPATLLLGIYYKTDYSFSSSKFTNNPENLDNTIYYYKKGISMIEELPNYPEGSTSDTESIEYNELTSFYLFIGLPFLYFKKYDIALSNIINNNTEEVSHKDMLKTLNKISEAATNCLNRPALDIWKEKERVYRNQQMICSAYLEFVKSVYSVEQQRIEADQNCTGPEKECTEHFDKLATLIKATISKIQSTPPISF